MRCFAPIQAVVTFSLAGLFLELKALYYRYSEVQNMGGRNLTFLSFNKRVKFLEPHTSCYTL